MNPQQSIKDLIDEGYTKEEALEMAKVEMKRRCEIMKKNKKEGWK